MRKFLVLAAMGLASTASFGQSTVEELVSLCSTGPAGQCSALLGNLLRTVGPEQQQQLAVQAMRALAESNENGTGVSNAALGAAYNRILDIAAAGTTQADTDFIASVSQAMGNVNDDIDNILVQNAQQNGGTYAFLLFFSDQATQQNRANFQGSAS